MKTLRNFIMKVIGNDRGFSMVQGIMLAAALGGASVMIMQQSKMSNQQTRTASTNMAVLELQGQIQNYLLLDTACTNSFRPLVLDANDKFGNVLSIKNDLDVEVFRVGEDYLNSQVRIELMTFTRKTDTQGILRVTFSKTGNSKNRGVGAARVSKDYPVNAEWSPGGNLLKCYSDIGSAVQTAVEQIITGVCNHGPNGLYLDSSSGHCQLTPLNESLSTPTGDPIGELVEPCPDGQAITQITYNPDKRQYSRVCGVTYALPPTCDTGSLLRRKSDGTFDCVKPSCPGTQIFQGLRADGTSICVACGAGQVAVNVGGKWDCRSMSCPANRYFLGIDTSGNSICNELVDTSSCDGTGKLSVVSGGKVKFECCTASCGDSGNYCSGTVYTSSNNCGICNGTKTPACGDPSTQCVGSYPSTNGCGSCEGTRLPQNGVWSAWSATSEYRLKAGATCSCTTNKIAQERKYVRSCTQPVCGGAPCEGSTEQWIEEGGQACTPTGCTPPGKCQGSGYDSSLFKMAYQDEVRGDCRTQYRDQYLDIDVSKFRRGNIYSITQGNTFSAEVLPGDTPRMVLQRIADKINAAHMTYPTLCNGAGSTVVTTATVVSDNRLKYHINWQHQTSGGGSWSCNIADQATCTATPGCSWNTTSANVCTGWNYQAKVGTCTGTYYRQSCMYDGSGSSQDMQCRYGYYDQAGCQFAGSQEGCYWGSVPETCYASTQAACSALGGGCSWKPYPDVHRSCTAASWEDACKVDGAGYCTWGPRE